MSTDNFTINRDEPLLKNDVGSELLVRQGKDSTELAKAIVTQFRNLVCSIFHEQDLEIQIQNRLNQNETETTPHTGVVSEIGNDSYFGVAQTSSRIVSFAIDTVCSDAGKIEDIKAEVKHGFNMALESSSGWLPEISYATHDAVIAKLDGWLQDSSPSQPSTQG